MNSASDLPAATWEPGEDYQHLLELDTPHLVFVLDDIFSPIYGDKARLVKLAAMCAASVHTYEVTTHYPSVMYGVLTRPGIDRRVRWATKSLAGREIRTKWPPDNIRLTAMVSRRQAALDAIEAMRRMPRFHMTLEIYPGPTGITWADEIRTLCHDAGIGFRYPAEQ